MRGHLVRSGIVEEARVDRVDTFGCFRDMTGFGRRRQLIVLYDLLGALNLGPLDRKLGWRNLW